MERPRRRLPDLTAGGARATKPALREAKRREEISQGPALRAAAKLVRLQGQWSTKTLMKTLSKTLEQRARHKAGHLTKTLDTGA